jgi:23S rRNA pseudouridine1911/1915/1917 synthase
MTRNDGWEYVRQIGAEGHGTLLAWLVAQFPHSDPTTWARRLRDGEVLVGGQARLEDEPIRPGDIVRWQRPPWDEAPAPRSFAVVVEAGGLLVVDKPAGLPTMPSGGFLRNTLLHAVRERFPGATPMHRLGTGTSGLVLFVTDPANAPALHAAFREGRVHRAYRGLAAGRVPPGPWLVDVPIGPVPHPLLGEIHAATPLGRAARTRGTAAPHGADDTVVDVVIETGRPHQIRIHLACLGHPLRGDPLYLPGGSARPDARPTDGGYLLHARQLIVDTPSGPLVVTREPPWEHG